GAFLSQNTYIEYLFGAVSISDNYSPEAKNLIVYFYQKWFGVQRKLVTSKSQFVITKQTEASLAKIYNGDNYENDFKVLKSTLKNLGYSVPILFRRYTELCEPEGVCIFDFGVDEAFSNCVDAMIMLDLKLLKESKRKRYFKSEAQ
ncbi:GNAT family N-acetyltransferase, partial [candidate division KSB1 bacterium]|nr:GNAT family N-acetyltransferase [candidate division KSB1 bacterium]